MWSQSSSVDSRRQSKAFIHVTFVPSSSVFPEFSRSSRRSFNVSASAPVGSTLGAVSATTLRPGVTRLTYRLVGGNVDHRFAVHPTTGQLTVAHLFIYPRYRVNYSTPT